MKTEIKVKLANGMEMPTFKTGSAQFNLQVYRFLSLYKGKKEMDLTKINLVALSKGYIMLRPFERLLVSTGIIIELPTGKAITVASSHEYVLKPGVTTITHLIGADGELLLILLNPCQFLTKICIDDVVAVGSIVNCEEIEFKA